MFKAVNCRKCRHILMNSTQSQSLLLNAHNRITNQDLQCSMVNDKTHLFVDEDNLPDWIKQSVENSNWTKGKLSCNHCGARIGAFDFVSGIKCVCNEFVMPSVHIIVSKVDVRIN